MHYFVTFGFGILVYWLTRLMMLRRFEVLQKKLDSIEEDNSKLSAEIDERNKDNLQMVISLTNLEARRVNRELTTSRQAFADLQGRFAAMAIVQRALAHRRRVSAVPAYPFLNEIINQQIEGFADSIECEVETNNLEIEVLSAGPLGLILHEITGQAVSRSVLIQDRQIRLELSEENGTLLINFSLCFSGEYTDTDDAEYALSDDIIEMMSDQITATLVKSQEKTQLQWRISYVIR